MNPSSRPLGGTRRASTRGGALRLLSALVAIVAATVGLLAGAGAASGASSTVIEAENFTDFGTYTSVFNDATASGGKALLMLGGDDVTGTVTTTDTTTTLTVTAKPDPCQGNPNVQITVDGTQLLNAAVTNTAWADYSAPVSIPAGTHTVHIIYSNDLFVRGTCDRNLRTDKVTFVGGGGSTPPPDLTPPAAPTGLVATAGDGTAALSWAANTESDLAGYNVYRSNTSGGPYTGPINGSLLTARTFNDSGLTNGSTYYYVVRAVDTSTNPSGNSNQAQATPQSSGGGGGGGGTSSFEAESMTWSGTYTSVFNDTAASGGKGVVALGADTLNKTATTGAGKVTVRARGDQCQGAPTMTVKVDGATLISTTVPQTAWTDFTSAGSIAAGSHSFQIIFSGDLFQKGVCDRNLRVDKVSFGAGSTTPPTNLLPDLVQQPPLQISVTQSSASFRLGFNSAVENHGAGPLVVNGHRASTATANMTADQVVNRSDGSTQTFPAIGSMIFYAPHNHWHYLNFDRYELRSTSGTLVAPDQKAGFCLGDRYTPNSNGTRNENPSPGPYTFNNCAPGNTAALSLQEGISVGYGDEYEPQLEGQYIDVTGVSPGTYVVVHRTNSDGALQESNSSNDAASALVSLWPNGVGVSPFVTVLKTCPGTATCSLTSSAGVANTFARSRWGIPVGGLPYQLRHSPPPDDPPLLVSRAARFYGHQALARIAGTKGSGRATLRRVTSTRRATRFAVSWQVNGSTYSGTIEVSLPAKNSQHWWRYAANLVRKDKAGMRHIRFGAKRVFVR
jgi:Ca-dependent carbohydrate-binding module xylan-binding/Lysyl oxidase